MADEFFEDPRLPNRPAHPDFWKLVDAILWQDGRADEASDIAEVIGLYVDGDSLSYVGMQRALRVERLMEHNDRPHATAAKLTAIFIDGFVAGCRYSERNLEREAQRKRGEA